MQEINVLFLDDEENILNSLKRLLMSEPFGIATTSDAGQALDIISKEKIKVVFSDERMPGISGVEFLGQVKGKFPDIVRILFTGYADISAAEGAINIGGVYRFINKPWNGNELKNTIHQAIQHYDLIMENRQLFEMTKRKNEELEVANRKLNGLYETQKEFTSTVSHELRTPLASIKTAIDIVVSGTPGPLNPDQKNFLDKARNNVDRLTRLINDILDLSKLEAGKTQLNFEIRDINAITLEIADIQQAVAQKKGLFMRTELAEDIAPVPLDVDKMHQVLSNLISNAIKFTEQGGVTLKTRNNKEANHVEVCVEDTGGGISQEDIPKLFKKFQQLGDPAMRKTGGTGLGLAICHEIIKQHGGKIWITSEEGKGSCFHFILPIQERRQER